MADNPIPRPPVDEVPGPPPYANAYTIFSGGHDVQIQLYYQAPGDTTSPRRTVCRAAMHAELLIRMLEGVIASLHPVNDRSTIERFMWAIAAKIPDEAPAEPDGTGEGN